MNYISVKSPSRRTIELPLEDDDSLLLTTLTSQFPDAIGLTFYCESSQGTRGLKVSEGKLWPPRGGWSNIIYSCTSIKERIYKDCIQQEERDYEFARRLAQLNCGTVKVPVVFQPQKRSGMIMTQQMQAENRKRDLSSWKYSELRDTINNSCDIALLEACKEEFSRRLKVYHTWKGNNSKKDVKEELQSEPKLILEAADKATSMSVVPPKDPSPSKINEQRYFRIPFEDLNSKPKGWWYAHFDGPWIARQIEIYLDKTPVLLVKGCDDMQMCELSLDETGLTGKQGAEILEIEFQREWDNFGGKPYSRPAQRSTVNGNTVNIK
ncbi:myosin heavy chain 95F-like isoform X2 [Artemia franciscana]